jgi:hypothetical protein
MLDPGLASSPLMCSACLSDVTRPEDWELKVWVGFWNIKLIPSFNNGTWMYMVDFQKILTHAKTKAPREAYAIDAYWKTQS